MSFCHNEHRHVVFTCNVFFFFLYSRTECCKDTIQASLPSKGRRLFAEHSTVFECVSGSMKNLYCPLKCKFVPPKGEAISHIKPEQNYSYIQTVTVSNWFLTLLLCQEKNKMQHDEVKYSGIQLNNIWTQKAGKTKQLNEP